MRKGEYLNFEEMFQIVELVQQWQQDKTVHNRVKMTNEFGIQWYFERKILV